MGKERQLKARCFGPSGVGQRSTLGPGGTLEGPRGEVGVAAGSKQVEIFCCDFAQSLKEFLSHPRLPLFLRL